MKPLPVTPAQVPWAVDVATPFVRVHASDEGPTRVGLLADFSAHAQAAMPANSEVELQFTGPGGWVRATPGEHEHRRRDGAGVGEGGGAGSGTPRGAASGPAEQFAQRDEHMNEKTLCCARFPT